MFLTVALNFLRAVPYRIKRDRVSLELSCQESGTLLLFPFQTLLLGGDFFRYAEQQNDLLTASRNTAQLSQTEIQLCAVKQS